MKENFTNLLNRSIRLRHTLEILLAALAVLVIAELILGALSRDLRVLGAAAAAAVTGLLAYLAIIWNDGRVRAVIENMTPHWRLQHDIYGNRIVIELDIERKVLSFEPAEARALGAQLYRMAEEVDAAGNRTCGDAFCT